jgi:hypothetical protein
MGPKGLGGEGSVALKALRGCWKADTCFEHLVAMCLGQMALLGRRRRYRA